MCMNKFVYNVTFVNKSAFLVEQQLNSVNQNLAIIAFGWIKVSPKHLIQGNAHIEDIIS